MESGSRLRPVEIKASSTFDRSMTRHLAAFSTLCPEADPGQVVYSGPTMPGVATSFAEPEQWCLPQ